MNDGTGATVCADCGRTIRPPDKWSYPSSVRWVHDLSPVGIGNRHCDTTSGCIAQPEGDAQ